ncbi:hypothetical protein [Paenibacillus illinoisensis]|uniref:hypothetical protein n=1 Tax=Paenibacillus illinoisensis TaxID=59845 RepID=UPI00301D9C55
MESVKGMFDIEIGFDVSTNEPIVLSEQARLLHEMIIGPTGSGLYSFTTLHQIKQDLKGISRGGRAGLIVLDSRDDMIRDVSKECEALGLQHINIIDFTRPAPQLNINPFKGPARIVASNFKEILSHIMGDQDEYFRGNQDEFVTFCILLGKTRFGDSFDLPMLHRIMTETRYLSILVDEVRKYTDEFLDEEPARQEVMKIVEYFDNEVLNYQWSDDPFDQRPISYPQGHKYEGMQVVLNRKETYIRGVKHLIGTILSHPDISQILSSSEGGLELDVFLGSFLKKGGVLLVNSGESDVSTFMGQLLVHTLQSAVFERSAFLAEVPVYLYINDMKTYMNYGLIRLLTLGRSYKVGVVCSMKELRDVDTDTDVFLSNVRNKVIYGGLNPDDLNRLSNKFQTPMTYEENRSLDFRHFVVDFVDEDLNAVQLRKAFI